MTIWRTAWDRGALARRPRLLAPGLLSLVIGRGHQRHATFLTDADYAAYRERLALYGQRYHEGSMSDLPQLRYQTWELRTVVP